MDDTITISRAEYEKLCEAAELLDDVQAYDAAMAKREEGLPHAFMVRLIEGESPVRVWREHRGLTQAALSEKAGLHRVALANIERGARQGSIDTMKALAAALGVTVDDLV